MKEAARIADQLQKSHEGNAWHGPALGELLDGVTAEQALARPLADAHSICEIVLHLAGWTDLTTSVLEGDPTREPREGDWPSLAEAGAGAWEQAVEKLNRAQARLFAAASKLPDSRLQETAAGRDYTIGFMLLGVLQHNAYHAGQIALLKKVQA
ncbi:MAG TPA: DinB family protein [Blastocatellia bacterium]|nr:DinB family protein [Blastocatellia bacterium]